MELAESESGMGIENSNAESESGKGKENSRPESESNKGNENSPAESDPGMGIENLNAESESGVGNENSNAESEPGIRNKNYSNEESESGKGNENLQAESKSGIPVGIAISCDENAADKEQKSKAKIKCITGARSSKYVGVSWSKKDNSWTAHIYINCQQWNLGDFKDDVEAAKAYDIAIIKNNLDRNRCVLNFPELEAEYVEAKRLYERSLSAGDHYETILGSKRKTVATTHTSDKRNTYKSSIAAMLELLESKERSATVDNNLDTSTLSVPEDRQQYKQAISTGISKYRGVTWNGIDSKWEAKISIKSQILHLGSFHDEVEAARAYDSAIVDSKLDSSKCNFPEDYDQYKEVVMNVFSKYRGVTWCNTSSRWKVDVSINSQIMHLGYFHDEVKAAKAYDAVIISNNLDVSKCNFPEDFELKKEVESSETSKYRGVTWYKTTKKWQAHISITSRSRHLGYFDDEVEAAMAYDAAIIKNSLDRSKLNFPIEDKKVSVKVNKPIKKKIKKKNDSSKKISKTSSSKKKGKRSSRSRIYTDNNSISDSNFSSTIRKSSSKRNKFNRNDVNFFGIWVDDESPPSTGTSDMSIENDRAAGGDDYDTFYCTPVSTPETKWLESIR